MIKTIKVEEKDWEKLWNLRIKLKLKNLSEVVSYILKDFELKKKN